LSSSHGRDLESPIVAQLREHFRAIRMQMDQGEEEYDEVDVDGMTYEELIELGDRIGKVSKGLDKSKM